MAFNQVVDGLSNTIFMGERSIAPSGNVNNDPVVNGRTRRSIGGGFRTRTNDALSRVTTNASGSVLTLEMLAAGQVVAGRMEHRHSRV